MTRNRVYVEFQSSCMKYMYCDILDYPAMMDLNLPRDIREATQVNRGQ